MDIAHDGQFRRRLEVVQRQADPRHVHGSGEIAQRLDKITLLQRYRAGERRQRRPRQIERRRRLIDPVVVDDARACKRSDRWPGVTACDIEESEWLSGVLKQNLMEPGIHLAMEKVIVIDHLAVYLPLLVE